MTAAWGRLPARLRLTLWYALVLAGTQLALGLSGLWLVQRALYANADDLLRSKAAAVQTEVDWAQGRLSFDAPRLPEGQMPAVAVGLDLVRIWDRDGRAWCPPTPRRCKRSSTTSTPTTPPARRMGRLSACIWSRCV